MANSKLFIPDQIHVGFQQRGDTYTGKLAYVIYTDKKGAKRKAQSWESWRDKRIPTLDCANTPVEGFVLNKGVGGARESYGWNARNEYIRVYDSEREFEFEISVANLLYILQETSSIKGKGLEGKFVYAWDGKDLVLLPENAQEYQACLEFTENQGKKVSAREMVAGRVYRTKQGEDELYLGKWPTAKNTKKWRQPFGITEHNEVVQHVFVPVGNVKAAQPRMTKALTHLAYEVSSDTSPDFLDALTHFQSHGYGDKFKQIHTEQTKINPLVINYHERTIVDIQTGRIGYIRDWYHKRVQVKWSNANVKDLDIQQIENINYLPRSTSNDYFKDNIPDSYMFLTIYAELESGTKIKVA